MHKYSAWCMHSVKVTKDSNDNPLIAIMITTNTNILINASQLWLGRNAVALFR